MSILHTDCTFLMPVLYSECWDEKPDHEIISIHPTEFENVTTKKDCENQCSSDSTCGAYLIQPEAKASAKCKLYQYHEDPILEEIPEEYREGPTTLYLLKQTCRG